MNYPTRRPGAGTHRASPSISRFTRNRSVNTTIWQPKNRDQLDAAKARVSIPDAWRALVLPGEPLRTCCSPFREDRHPSFSISSCGRLWKDFAADEGGDVVSFVKRATACTDAEAIRRVLELAGGITSPVALAPRHGPTKPVPAPYDGLAGLDLQPPTLHEVIALAELRDWPTFAGLELAASRGLLRFSDVKHRGETHRTWIFTDSDRKSAQARRLDGEPWAGETHTFKSKTLRTDPDAPPGLADVVANNRPAVLICEGEADTLAALLLAWAGGIVGKVGVICLTGASKPLPPAVLEKLRGRRCRVIRQTDPAGHKAALAWAESIHAAGITVDLANLDGRTRADGKTAKDVADLCQRPNSIENLEQLAADVFGNLSQ
ncbi:MAG: CHC2 zinc finger domain-containing protein [Verrucomicrobia bacterium]|nr:CHC2 zinc finger domain-containing protein [Verrucomicrobiota bacterium]